MKNFQKGSATSVTVIIGTIVVLAILGTAGYFLYEAQQPATPSPILVSTTTQTVTNTQNTPTVPQPTPAPAPTTPAQQAPTAVGTNSSTGTANTNCGETMAVTSMDGHSLDNDSAMICLGKNFVANCSPATAIVEASPVADDFSISGGNFNTCKITIANQTNSSQHITCSLSAIAEQSNKTLADIEGGANKAPSTFMQSLFIAIELQGIGTTPAPGCSVSL